MRTAFVIGGTGFVGRHLVAQLARQGLPVAATHRPGSVPPAIAGVDWISCDLAAADCTRNWPGQYDAIYYLAQSARWRDFPAAVDDIFRVNLAALQQAAEHARLAGARQFVHFSTGTVYSQTQEPAREDEAIRPAAPRSYYASTKLAGELLLQPYSAFFGVTQLRLFMPYGVGQNERMLLPSLVAKIRGGVPVELHQPDGLRCNPVSVLDVVEGARRVLDLKGSHTLNLAGPELLTLRQIAEIIAAALGIMPRFEVRPEAAPVIAGDTSRLRETLNWCPTIRFAEGVRAWLAATGD